MRKFLGFFKATIVGGVWFLIPIVVLGIVLGKVHHFTSAIVRPLANAMPIESVIGVEMTRLLAALAIVVFCFFTGLFAMTPLAKKIISWLEFVILSNLPGYSFMKSMGGSRLGVQGEKTAQVVVAKIEDALQIGFLVEQIEADLYAVFVPGAPSPWSGSVYFMREERFTRINISPKEAMRCVRSLGVGSDKLLSGRIKL